MKKDPKSLAEEIIKLVSELAMLAGEPTSSSQAKSRQPVTVAQKDTSGATGGIRLMVEEGKLDSPKKLPEIVVFLKQEGRHYSDATVSMGLLNLVRELVPAAGTGFPCAELIVNWHVSMDGKMTKEALATPLAVIPASNARAFSVRFVITLNGPAYRVELVVGVAPSVV